MPKKKKRDFGPLLSALAIIVILALTYIFLRFSPEDPGQERGIDRTQCPHEIEGNLNASFVIRYIDSPYCVWCWFEESVLKEAVKTKGNSFKLERYDIRYCPDVVNRYGFSGTPSFVFSLNNGTKEYSHSGYVDRVNFYSIICKATGDCNID